MLCLFEILGHIHVDCLLDQHECDLEFQIGTIITGAETQLYQVLNQGPADKH